MTGDNRQDSDEALMQRIAKNDKSAFRVLADRHIKGFYAIAYRMGFSREDAEDIVQETLIRIWDKAGSWDAQKSKAAKSWLYRVGTNICLDHKRKEKRRPATVDIEPETVKDTGRDAEEKMQNKQLRQRLTRAMDGLPERQRAALILCHYQGFTNGEAAAILGTSGKSVESLLARARKNLKQDLQIYGDTQ